MSEGEQKTDAPKEPPAMGQIVGHLKDYPFLLVTIAGLLFLSGALIFEIEKLKEFKWLIFAVVLVPLAFQFLFEFRKTARPAPAAVPAPAGASPAPPPAPSALPPSRKAWVSVIVGVLLLGAVAATPEAELYDQDFALGFLALAVLATGFGFAALSEVRQGRAGSKGMAWTGLVLSAVLALAALGWLTGPAPQPEAGTTGAAAPGAPDPAGLPPAPPVAELPQGRFQLLGYTLNQVPQNIAGTLSIARQAAGLYAWQSQLAIHTPSGVQAFAYSGHFQNRNGQWFAQVSASTDPDWNGPEDLPVTFAADGSSLVLHYTADGGQIVSSWARSP